MAEHHVGSECWAASAACSNSNREREGEEETETERVCVCVCALVSFPTRQGLESQRGTMPSLAN